MKMEDAFQEGENRVLQRFKKTGMCLMPLLTFLVILRVVFFFLILVRGQRSELRKNFISQMEYICDS
jgi:hypothetical protein